jgi:hypothetical protein
MKDYPDICNLRRQLEHKQFWLLSTPIITTVTVEVLNGFVK